ncbi:MAG: hypothetical protein KY469_21105 [Actinobacteria bacterium]|nr:hypothetical protein [Actinomycetota bacterium]
MSRKPHPLDTPDFALLDRLVHRLGADGHVSDDVRRAVDLLTAAAAPERADRLAVRPGEPPAIVERLAVWALARTTDAAVATATGLLDDAMREPVTASEDDRVLLGSAAQQPQSAGSATPQRPAPPVVRHDRGRALDPCEA